MLTGDERWDLDLLKEAVRYQRWALSSFGGAIRGRVLEAGAGIGNFTRWISRDADAVVVAEPEADLCEEIDAMGLPNVKAVPAPIEALDAEPFDTAVPINVLEHIEDDLAALRATFDLLNPGGRVCILVPAHPLLYGTLDARYEHFRRYRRSDVDALLTKAGFVRERLRYFNPVGAVGWFLVGRVLRPKRLSPSSVVLTERIGVPVGKLLERLGPPPFGQSVVAIGRRL